MEPTEKQIIDGNRLIAEFMGVAPHDGWYDGWELQKAGLPFSMGAMGNGTDSLKFHLSWDWLMFAVEKIEDLEPEFQVVIYEDEVEIWRKENSKWEQISNVSADGSGKLRNTWLAVIEFIKWYNKNK